MATNDTTTADEKVAESMLEAIVVSIGVDCEGDAHIYRPAADRVEVFSVDAGYELGDQISGEPETTEDVDGRAVDSWVRYVEHERGWDRTTRHAEGAL